MNRSTNYDYVGQTLPRTDVLARATGRARYVEDITLPHMLFGAILRSPHPHARILAIDVTKAARLAGVKAVITANDLPPVAYGMSRDGMDQYVLARDKVRYVGEEVAAVAAVDADTAYEARELIRVEYEPLPAVFDIEEAVREGAPRIHDYAKNNVNYELRLEYGDVDRAWDACYIIREDTFRTNVQAHCSMQPLSVLASWDEHDGVEMWMPNQSPFAKRRALSNVLNLPLSSVKIRKSESGGAFGGRSELFSIDVCAAALARRAGRPVRIDYTREEEFVTTRQRHGMVLTVKTGMSRDGHIVAKEMRLLSDNGAYSGTGTMAVMNVPSLLLATMRIPNFAFLGRCVFTNTTVRGAMRGHGMPQMRFADGLQTDLMARDLGVDPLEIRLKNAVQAGDVTPYKSRITASGLSLSLAAVARASEWSSKRGKLDPLKGIGIGCGPCISAFHVGPRTASAALIKFDEDGAITLLTGAVDNGQGNESMLTQILCEELKVPPARVRIIAADTERTPQDQGAFSMATTFVTGNAVRNAALDAREQLLRIAAELLEVGPQDLLLRADRVEVRGSPSRCIPVRDLVRKGLILGQTVLGKGSYMPRLDNIYAKGRLEGQITGAFTHGAVVVEIEIDATTGRVKVNRVVAAHDIGFAINPGQVEGSIQGAVVMGIGMALSEGIAWDGGQVMNASFLDYKMPCSIDLPEIEVILIETIDPDGPYGAKEASGQDVVAATVEAVANAILDATGAMITSLPFTPEKVLRAIGNYV